LLTNHRRALWWALALIAACVFVVLAVGRHPASEAPKTTLSFVGRFDQQVYVWSGDIRNVVLTKFFLFMNIIGGGAVTIPVRSIASIVLLFQRRWRAFSAFVLTWIVAEVSLQLMKGYFHRGRPPGPLVTVSSYSFPSGHAIAASATAVALVLAFFPPGPRRRKWEWAAVGFAFLMAVSRVYLWAHWFSDTVVGVLLGAGIAIGCAALVTEIRDVYFRRRGIPIPRSADPSSNGSGSASEA
jgi:membrane-associated phospholipid phosphatase